MGAVLVDVGSLPAEHTMSHIPPLHVLTMRPLALDADDPMSVHIPVDGTQMSIQTICDAAEWMGQAAQTHDGGIARPLQVVCDDASLQKQVLEPIPPFFKIRDFDCFCGSKYVPSM